MDAIRFGLLAAVSLLVPGLLNAQTIIITTGATPVTRPDRIQGECRVTSVEVNARIRDQAATVQIAQVFQNTGSSTLEAQLFFPIPDDAAVSRVTLLVNGQELTGKLMKKEEARRIYEEIVRRRKDPALLEYIGQGLYQTSVFPIPAGEKRTVQIRYEQLLRTQDGLADLLLPIGTAKHSGKPVDSLSITAHIETSEKIKTIYSPTHSPSIKRPDDTHAEVTLTLQNVSSPDDFRLLFGTGKGSVGANVVSHQPEKDEPGYFVLLASPELPQASAEKTARTLLYVIDRSGSMSGEKMEQAKSALRFVVERLQPEDTFNIVAYDSTVETFRPELQKGSRESIDAALGFVNGLFAGGGTNINEALTTGLKMLKDKNRPTYVLFFTDGQPTVGEQDESKIAANAKQANEVGARIFNFGVGYDVNSRLLDRLSRQQRGQSVYVRPNEDIETSVSSLYQKIGSPAMTNVKVRFEFDEPQPASAPATVSRMYPQEMPDLFHGEQLVLVGRYAKSGAAKLTLTGTLEGKEQPFTFPVTFAEHSNDETHAYAERLWAIRRVGDIIDQLDLNGENQELVNELVELSTKHGIMTPYTSFLAEEDVELADRGAGLARAREEVELQIRNPTGQAGFEQRRFKAGLQDAAAPTRLSTATADYFGARSGRDTAETPAIRQIGRKTFFRKQGRWEDASLTPEQKQQAVRVEQFSNEFFELVSRDRGRLAKYLTFDEPALMQLDGQTYLVVPPKRGS